MTTWSLLRWIALVAGVELAVRGHLADHGLACHGGGLLAAGALLALLWPSRARRLGAVAGALLGAVVAIDAGVAAWAGPEDPASAAPERTRPPEPDPKNGGPEPDGESGGPAPDETTPDPGDGLRVLAFGGATTLGPADGDERPWPALLADELARACPRPVEVVSGGRRDAPLGGGAPVLADALSRLDPDLVLLLGGPELLEDVLAEAPALRHPPPAPLGRRASPLGRVLETQWRRADDARRWRRARAADTALDPARSPVAARYRELVLAARRSGVEIALLRPSLALAPDASLDVLRDAETTAPHTRSWVLAHRAHARVVRAIAGAYGLRALDPGIDGAGGDLFLDLARPTAAGRARLAQAVASGLSGWLARPETGCGGAD